MADKNNLLRNLACFACEYSDVCMDNFEKDSPQCKMMYERADTFVQCNINLISEKEK